ncbi:MAG: hypothetical protein AAF585_28770 [Verrucomicrobiota bacterium]
MRNKHGEIDIEVTVKTTELLERLKENREKHSTEYEAAIELWQQEFQKVLEEVKPSELRFFPKILEDLNHTCPESHIDEYDQAIDMFTMCTKEEVTLDSEAFNTFCRDEWGWKNYVSTNRFYRRAALRR